MSLTLRPFYGLSLLVSLVLVSCLSCKPELVEPPSSTSITKSDREILGDRLLALIANQPDYPILANTGDNASVYQFVQTLYNQATASIRLDINSPIENRWNLDREWSVHIIDRNDILDAFTLPGGHLFITTGFLKNIQREYELFYVLAFEACLINEKFLLSRMVLEYNTVNLKSIIDGATVSNGITAMDILKGSTEFIFNADEVGQIDAFTIPEICNTSVYRGDGISQIINRAADVSNYWLERKKNYSGRADRAITIATTAGNCGSLRTNGAYQEFVLNVLD